MHRLAILPLIALLVSSCNTPDAALGVTAGSEANPAGGATRSTNVTRVDLGTLGGASSYAADINSGNTVVGWSETSSGTTHAFRWTPADGMVDLGTLPGDAMSRAVAVLDAPAETGALILGVSGDDGRWTPVVWSSTGSIRSLPIPLLPSFTLALPQDFNARGDVVGIDGPGFEHGWVWSETGGKYDLSANVPGGSFDGGARGVTASGLVVLTVEAPTCRIANSCWRTYLWSKTAGYIPIGTPGNDPEATVTGIALNEFGTVVGTIVPTISGQQNGSAPYRWAPTTGFTLLANYTTDGSRYGYATDVNSSGTVVGADFEPASGSVVASKWLPNGGIVKLSPDDPSPGIAIAINNPGTIAGWAAISDGVNHAVIWKPSSQASPTAIAPAFGIQAPTTAATRVFTASAPCLADPRSIISREALFACVIKADRKR